MLMLFIIAIMLSLAIVGFIIYKVDKSWNADGWGIAALILLFIGAMLLMIVIACYVDYIQFEKTFEIQRGIFAQINENIADIDRPYIVADIINANETLAKYQGGEMIWGIWNITPARVMRIVPIGVG